MSSSVTSNGAPSPSHETVPPNAGIINKRDSLGTCQEEDNTQKRINTNAAVIS
jgi:hypothetical protein